jgi:hypothetical protein
MGVSGWVSDASDPAQDGPKVRMVEDSTP